MKNKLLKTIIGTGIVTLPLVFGFGCDYIKKDIEDSKNRAGLHSVSGSRELGRVGAITFSYQDKVYFDGTLDRVIYFKGMNKIEVTKEDPKFSHFISGYEKAREIATRGN